MITARELGVFLSRIRHAAAAAEISTLADQATAIRAFDPTMADWLLNLIAHRWHAIEGQLSRSGT